MNLYIYIYVQICFYVLCDDSSGPLHFFCGHIASDVSFWSLKGQLFSGALIWLEESRLTVLTVTGFIGQGAQCWPSNRHEPSVMFAMCQCATNVVNHMWKLHMRTLVNHTAIEDIDWSRRGSCGFDCLLARLRSKEADLAFWHSWVLHSFRFHILVKPPWCFVMFLFLFGGKWTPLNSVCTTDEKKKREPVPENPLRCWYCLRWLELFSSSETFSWVQNCFENMTKMMWLNYHVNMFIYNIYQYMIVICEFTEDRWIFEIC